MRWKLFLEELHLLFFQGVRTYHEGAVQTHLPLAALYEHLPCSRKLLRKPRIVSSLHRTMVSLLQHLCEKVLITYMRTADSVS